MRILRLKKTINDIKNIKNKNLENSTRVNCEFYFNRS